MTAAESADPGGGRRLLVVDDLEPVRLALVQMLEQAGYEVAAAATADEALRLLPGTRWDGVVMDVDLANGSGVELYARMLRLRGDQRLPVVFFSGHAHYALRLSLWGTAWARVVEKPCGSKKFLAILEECLRAAGSGALPPGI